MNQLLLTAFLYVLGALLFIVTTVVAVLCTTCSDLIKQEAATRLERLPLWLLHRAARDLPADIRDEVLDEQWIPDLLHVCRDADGMPLTRVWKGARFAIGLMGGPAVAVGKILKPGAAVPPAVAPVPVPPHASEADGQAGGETARKALVLFVFDELESVDAVSCCPFCMDVSVWPPQPLAVKVPDFIAHGPNGPVAVQAKVYYGDRAIRDRVIRDRVIRDRVIRDRVIRDRSWSVAAQERISEDGQPPRLLETGAFGVESALADLFRPPTGTANLYERQAVIGSRDRCPACQRKLGRPEE
ncbi:hypothetical protein [Planomonospora sp. ID82291]|uniref:hypothetical protein n=1 Tax=Planomonospora sp. ID82291 TaxID=2738136 RepID=UPI0018C3A8C2|nr:hypothetical protein [Planomonospora sp. ID82291]MBG0818286.1 hypothetical protein [Planomonospora sp. ID82291]